MPTRIRKFLSLFKHPRFIEAAIVHRVAAATEHLTVIEICAANTLLDIGANKGQFSLAFRTLRPQGRIVAFEPLSEAADQYEHLFAGSSEVTLLRVALSNRDANAEFFVADRSDSSSLLAPGKGQEQAFGIRTAQTIEVPVKRLDGCIDVNHLRPPVMMKVDVQGGELQVLEGASASLAAVDFIYIELSFVELYEGQPLFQDVSEFLSSNGFTIAGIFNQVTTERCGPTQVDVLFRRK